LHFAVGGPFCPDAAGTWVAGLTGAVDVVAGARVAGGSAAAGEVAVAPAEAPEGAEAAAVVPVGFAEGAPLSTPP
jgi:hypothetical protein